MFADGIHKSVWGLDGCGYFTVFQYVTSCSVLDGYQYFGGPNHLSCLLCWRWKQQVPLKHWYLSTKLYSSTSWKVIIWTHWKKIIILMAVPAALNIQLCVKYFFTNICTCFGITWIQKTFKISSTHWADLTHLQTRQSPRVAQFARK